MGRSSKDIVFTDIGCLLSLAGVARKRGRDVAEKDLSRRKNAAMVCKGGRLVWVGPTHQVPREYKGFRRQSLERKTVLPAFVECHTHSVFAGQRAAEFELRNQGVSYQEIARRGGGILSTVQQTRKASLDHLIATAQRRVERFLAQGVTTVEIKSGYGLRLKDELKMLQAARRLKNMRVVTTYLGPHAVAPESRSATEYMQSVLQDLPQVVHSKLADRADIFIEKGFFERPEGERYLRAAARAGLPLTVHADQLQRSGAGLLATRLGAQSADHLVQINARDVQALAKSSTVAVLLPAADAYLQMKYPPARRLLEEGARVALATDFNPGSSPTQDLAWVGLLARLEMKMSLPEVIAAYTINAAAALGLEDDLGSLERGKLCDFIALETDWSELFYHVGDMGVTEVWREGRSVWRTRQKS